jgi:Uma2 family endonuclease
MTVEEFAALPDDGWRYELVEGVPRRMPPGGLEHGGIAGTILWHVRGFVQPRSLGLVGAEIGFVFPGASPTLRVPDVSFVRAERLPPRDQWARYPHLVPDLVVEIISPSDEPADIAAKTAFYLAAGVPLQWWVDPATRTVAVYRPGREPETRGVGERLTGEEIVPGFSLPVADIFAP